MEHLIAARYNLFWYLSLIAPAVIMLFFTSMRKKNLMIIGVIISLITTYSLCNLSVEKKWKTRNEIAKTEQERAYATADSANLVFTAIFIGPFESILYTSFWGFIGIKIWPRPRKEDKEKNITSG